MKNKAVCIILTLLLAAAFSGCQLAHEELAQPKKDDKLIGVFVTYEHLDLFDMESYLNDNINNFSDGGSIQINGDDDKYNNRLDATLIQEEKTATGGEKYTDSRYVFEGLEGISMFSPAITDPITGDSYVSSDADAGIADCKSHYSEVDNEKVIELEGTVYVTSGAMSDGIYMNPVYQSDDGAVYLQSGQGFMASGDNGEGGVYTQTMTASTSRTENKTVTTFSSSIKLSVATMNPTEKVAIFQMDGTNNIIAKDEYPPDSVPDQITPDISCEYLIVESHKTAFDGERKVERQIFSNTDASLYYFVKGSSGVLFKTYSSIIWESKDNI
ncbi:MAG: hypothetical protein RSD35_03535 [Oscillospiraceae bacterium]